MCPVLNPTLYTRLKATQAGRCAKRAGHKKGFKYIENLYEIFRF